MNKFDIKPQIFCGFFLIKNSSNTTLLGIKCYLYYIIVFNMNKGEQFIKKANAVHDNKYSYSKVEYYN